MSTYLGEIKTEGGRKAFRENNVRILRLLILGLFLISLVGMPAGNVKAAATITFTGEELLGRPTDDSITVNILPATTIEYHYQYGTSPGIYTLATSDQTAAGGQPHEVVISGLSANTQYYYRMQYHAPGDAPDDWVNRSEHSFWTQRAEGSSFTFSVTSDSHATFNTSHQNTMTNILNEDPDFEIDLGDTFYVDNMTSQTAVNNKYLAYREPLYMDKIGPTVPIFLASGNHENEEGWNFDDTFSIALASIQARKLYFPTPIQDGFYTGNTEILPAIDAATYGDQLREDYYAWTWGDALFVVIDEFQYTMDLSYTPAAGEGTDDAVTGDQWSWTLGAQQYQWFKQTLENSEAKYKFVFSHQMTGGITRAISGVGAGYVRGGAEAAAYFEWGGQNADGSEGFAGHRNPADFGTEPIHQLMVANGVSAYFHGHDHQYVYETRDGIVYQEVPSPSMTGSGFSGIYTEGDHGTYNTIKMLPNAGHLRISVTPTQASVDYISASSTSGTVNYTYTIEPEDSGSRYTLTTAVSAGGGGTISPAAGAHLYNEGEVVSVTAIPNVGYAFDHWSGACTGSGACSVTMDEDKSVTAHFILTSYVITASAGAHGTISPTGTVLVSPGADQEFTVTPAAGYHVANVVVDSASVGAVTSYTFINVTINHTITASFAINTYTITASAGANGAITPSGGITVNHGDSQSFTIAPATGFHVADVLVDGSTVGAVTSYTFNNVTANHTIAASFEANPVTYTITASAGANGTVTPNGAVIVNHGANQGFTITPATGYHVADVLVDGSTVGAVTSYTFNNVTANHTIAASFAINTYTITATAGANGTITPSGGVIVSHDADQGFTITPAVGYHVLDVLVDGTSVGAITNYTFTNVIANHTIAASFAINTYTITATAGANGTITPSGGVMVSHGANQAFSITPAVGFHVVNVVVDSVSVGAMTSYTFTKVTSNHTIVASFAINTYTITASAGANGTITPSGAITVNHGDSQSFMIAPATGYHVTGVLVDSISLGAVTSYTFTDVTANHSISANFAINPVDNTPPVITEGASIAVSMNKNGVLNPFTLTLHATDVDGDTLTWSIAGPAGHGTATVSGTGSSKVIDFDPENDFIGTDSFVVQVSDGLGGIDTIIVSVIVKDTVFLPLIIK